MATDAREEEGALDLGVKLMSKFARSSRGHRRTTRQVFAVWKRYHETIKKNTMYAMNIANLMRRALQRRNFFRWRERLLRAREENRKVQRARRITARNKRVRAFARWRDAHREGRGVRGLIERIRGRRSDGSKRPNVYSWCYADDEICVARGSSGSTAVWVRA